MAIAKRRLIRDEGSKRKFARKVQSSEPEVDMKKRHIKRKRKRKVMQMRRQINMAGRTIERILDEVAIPFLKKLSNDNLLERLEVQHYHDRMKEVVRVRRQINLEARAVERLINKVINPLLAKIRNEALPKTLTPKQYKSIKKIILRSHRQYNALRRAIDKVIYEVIVPEVAQIMGIPLPTKTPQEALTVQKHKKNMLLEEIKSHLPSAKVLVKTPPAVKFAPIRKKKKKKLKDRLKAIMNFKRRRTVAERKKVQRRFVTNKKFIRTLTTEEKWARDILKKKFGPERKFKNARVLSLSGKAKSSSYKEKIQTSVRRIAVDFVLREHIRDNTLKIEPIKAILLKKLRSLRDKIATPSLGTTPREEKQARPKMETPKQKQKAELTTPIQPLPEAKKKTRKRKKKEYAQLVAFNSVKPKSKMKRAPKAIELLRRLAELKPPSELPVTRALGAEPKTTQQKPATAKRQVEATKGRVVEVPVETKAPGLVRGKKAKTKVNGHPRRAELAKTPSPETPAERKTPERLTKPAPATVKKQEKPVHMTTSQERSKKAGTQQSVVRQIPLPVTVPKKAEVVEPRRVGIPARAESARLEEIKEKRLSAASKAPPKVAARAPGIQPIVVAEPKPVIERKEPLPVVENKEVRAPVVEVKEVQTEIPPKASQERLVERTNVIQEAEVKKFDIAVASARMFDDRTAKDEQLPEPISRLLDFDAKLAMARERLNPARPVVSYNYVVRPRTVVPERETETIKEERELKPELKPDTIPLPVESLPVTKSRNLTEPPVMPSSEHRSRTEIIDSMNNGFGESSHSFPIVPPTYLPHPALIASHRAANMIQLPMPYKPPVHGHFPMPRPATQPPMKQPFSRLIPADNRRPSSRLLFGKNMPCDSIRLV